jgi:DNA-binding transcriptional ArsR family regulator
MSLLPSKPETTQPEDAEPRVVGVDSDDADDVISALSSETARELLAELHEEPAPPAELSDRVDTSLQNAQYHLEKLQSAGAVSVVDTAYSEKGREMDVYAPADQPLVIFAGNDEKTTGLKAALSRLLGGAGLLALGSFVVQSLYGDTQDAASAPLVPGDGGGNGNGGAGGNGGEGGGVVAPAEDDDAVTTVQDGTSGGDGNGGAQIQEETVDRSADGEDVVEVTEAPEGTDVDTYLETNVDAGNVTVEAPNETVTAVDPGNVTTPEPTTTPVPDPTPETTAQAADAAVAGGLEPGLVFFLGGALVLSLYLAAWYVDI